MFLDLCCIVLSYDDVLVGDDFGFIHPPRSISSLLLVALFKVDTIDAYITAHTECVSATEEPPVSNV